MVILEVPPHKIYRARSAGSGRIGIGSGGIGIGSGEIGIGSGRIGLDRDRIGQDRDQIGEDRSGSGNRYFSILTDTSRSPPIYSMEAYQLKEITTFFVSLTIKRHKTGKFRPFTATGYNFG